MKLFRGQQFWEYQQAKCAPCDIAYYKTTEQQSNWCFQVGLSSENIFYKTLETNPFNPITTTNFSFDITSLPTGTNYFTLYCEDKIYVFIKSIAGVVFYEETIIGNLSLIYLQGASGVTFISNLLLFFNEIFDVRHGTTSTLSAPTFTISNLPSNSFLDDNLFNLLANITSIGSQETPIISVTNGYYNKVTQQICCYFFIEDSFILRYELNLTNGKRYNFSFDTVTEFSNWIGGKFRINNLSDVTEYDLVYDNKNSFYYDANVTGNHIIDIVFDDATIPHLSGLCIDNLKLDSLCKIDSVDVLDVTNNIDASYFSEALGDMTVDYYNDKALVCINAYSILTNHPINDCYQMTIRDSCDNEILTNLFKFFNDTCDQRKFLEVSWFSDCKFGDIDYLNLPFVNTIFLQSWIKRIPLQLNERVTFKQYDGSSKSVYSATVKRYEFNTGKYSEVMHEQIETIFENKFVLIETEQYYVDKTDKYDIADIGSIFYKGRVELSKKGTELVVSDCCC